MVLLGPLIIAAIFSVLILIEDPDMIRTLLDTPDAIVGSFAILVVLCLPVAILLALHVYPPARLELDEEGFSVICVLGQRARYRWSSVERVGWDPKKKRLLLGLPRDALHLQGDWPNGPAAIELAMAKAVEHGIRVVETDKISDLKDAKLL